MLNREDALQEDLLFHLAIARASGNTTMNAFMLKITPKIISIFENNRICDYDKFILELQRHETVFEVIKNKNVTKAIEGMEMHFEMLADFCKNFKESDEGLIKLFIIAPIRIIFNPGRSVSVL